MLQPSCKRDGVLAAKHDSRNNDAPLELFMKRGNACEACEAGELESFIATARQGNCMIVSLGGQSVQAIAVYETFTCEGKS